MTVSWGIDPGTMTSPTGLAILEDGKILDVVDIMPTKEILKQDVRSRIRYICNQVSLRFGSGTMPNVVGIECSFYKGKANQTLNRFIGALEHVVPFTIPVIEVNPMTLKKFITGSGKSDKEEMAEALKDKWFTDSKSRTILGQIIRSKQFDQSDAVSIAVYAAFCHSKEGK